jgi:hypothetical protein
MIGKSLSFLKGAFLEFFKKSENLNAILVKM